MRRATVLYERRLWRLLRDRRLGGLKLGVEIPGIQGTARQDERGRENSKEESSQRSRRIRKTNVIPIARDPILARHASRTVCRRAAGP